MIKEHDYIVLTSDLPQEGLMSNRDISHVRELRAA